jgi:ribosome-dependent ATPase
MSSQPVPVVQALGLTQRYRKTIALDQVNLDVPAGQMVGLLGPDGVGKSTLMDLIAGARVMQEGSLTVLGGDIGDSTHRRLVGPRIAYMPQGLGKNLYHTLSVQENMDFFGRLFGLGQADRQARIERLTHATGLYPFLSRPVGKLSGGMKQKLGLCCSLLHDPDLLILDEPTTGVDPLSRRQFWDLIDAIRAERPGMTVLVSTAYMDEASGFDWLVAMDAGRVLDSGTPADLIARTGAPDLEGAFVRLLPEDKRTDMVALEIPPLIDVEGPPAIRAEGLTKRFGDFTAVSNVNFEIRPGEIFGFLGSNGCGKTTVMKMLTGLLPMTEGEAQLFGEPVDATDLETRKRVGFMSQSFSLYGELTVVQNLSLHARLFDMEATRATTRIAELAQRFDLGDIMDMRAGNLPLGLRQRLSLAVAVLHEPEILILDEPTSGVDPVARDHFWDLLADLSREKKVTIFISTHFMGEAMRCDRISLMHAGEVLVYDTPENLAAQSESGTLEETFIHYIEGALAKNAKDTPPPISGGLVGHDLVPHRTDQRFSMTRLLAISYRESMDLLRDPIRLVFAMVGSVFLLVVIALGISMDIEDVTIAVLDHDQTPESRAYMDTFFASNAFLETPPLQDRDALLTRLRAGKTTVTIEIPNGFGRDLNDGHQVAVSAWMDGANTMRAGTVEAYVNGAHQFYMLDAMRARGIDTESLTPYSVQSRYRYNPNFDSINAIGPAVPALLLLLIPVILMALSIAREKEIGTITNFYVTPTSKVEFLLGKQLPYIGVSMINFVLLTATVVLVLGVPIKGSLVALTLGTLIYAVVVTAYGLMVSSATRTQVAAIMAAAILSMMPTIQFSGLIQPISTLSDTGQWIGTFWPASYFMHLSVGSYTKGLSLMQVMPDLLGVLAFAPIFMGAALLLLRKQEK